MSILTLSSPDFDDGQEIPRECGYKHGNKIPNLSISNIPENTKSLVLIMDDPDAMDIVGKVWVHWLMWNISPSDKINSSTRAVLGKTDFGEVNYGGPAPPDKRHTYIFKLYAIDTILDLPLGSDREQLKSTIDGHIIQETSLKGTFTP
ncbi:MAG: YbhB/YbcL family Raf kinase inhibitor-like protein [Candidatus Nitrosoabyssus spongiisocia]|nr:MAG: YbhB/YbcL family Raf kinase inhibitor-like protein [Nitrosopumilaceae archaeon AB1(1)]